MDTYSSDASHLPEARNTIITDLVSVEASLELQVIQKLLEPCDRKTYGQRLKAAAEKLECSVRTVQRLVKKWEEDGLGAFAQTERRDKGHHRIGTEWQKFIIDTYNKGKCTPAQVAVKVKTKAKAEGLNYYPSHMTVYRILAPLIERQQQKDNIRNIGWKGSRLALKTRDGEQLTVEHSNQVWQCDHTRADVLLVDQHGKLLGRPWLTTVVDTYSRCIVGFNLGFNAPSSKVVALALRHAILPKEYGADYKLYKDWNVHGKPEHLFTDGGKDFRSKHLEQIGMQLGFTCHLRDHPSEGGIVERPFGTFNTEFFATLPGYTDSNVQKRPANAEKEASLTLRELEQLFVAYLVNKYNQGLDARMRNQTRIERWEAGLLQRPPLLSERALDICLMKETRRTIYRGGSIQFENLVYQNDDLAAHAGNKVVIRYDPRDITTVLVYEQETVQNAQGLPLLKREIFLATAKAQDLETEQLSQEDAKAISDNIRQLGKAVDNHSILDEMRDREAFLNQKKKSRRDRQKEEQAMLPRSQKAAKLIKAQPAQTAPEIAQAEPELEIPKFEIWDFDED